MALACALGDCGSELWGKGVMPISMLNNPVYGENGRVLSFGIQAIFALLALFLHPAIYGMIVSLPDHLRERLRNE